MVAGDGKALLWIVLLATQLVKLSSKVLTATSTAASNIFPANAEIIFQTNPQTSAWEMPR